MLEFFFGVLSLVLIAVLMVAVPWFRAKQQQQRVSADPQQMNIELTRQRLAELQSEHKQNLLSDEDRAQAEKELKSALADEFSEGQQQIVKSPYHWLIWGSVVVILALVSAVYWHSSQLGKMQHWQQAMQKFPDLARRAVMQADQTVTEQELTDLALGLRTTLRDKPEDAVAWLLLGRVYNAIGYVEPAIEAFERSLKLNPEHKGARISLSQTLAMTNQPQQLQRAKGYLQQLLTEDPQDYDALGLLAIVASQLDDKPLAIQNWQKLLLQVPKSDPLYQSLQQRIDELRGDAGQSATQQTAFTITVDVDEALRSKIPAKGFVVVFAQNAETNMQMPAAVVKQSLQQWPVSIELTDNNAMLASYKLSDLKQARLVARISVDENVQKAPGDLQGEIIAPVQPGQNVAAKIMIDQEVTQ
ncbi:c-type cytochrome biogenesis protein CcmI [Neptunicella sp. SCSIO 80796]|uniref:c-type cytochrome biogenesis protein CcmI n=1 Tax=Neptunicella plasticusilytica TaxID=3117012 RepID=UPI003A4E106F